MYALILLAWVVLFCETWMKLHKLPTDWNVPRHNLQHDYCQPTLATPVSATLVARMCHMINRYKPQAIVLLGSQDCTFVRIRLVTHCRRPFKEELSLRDGTLDPPGML